MPSPPSHTISSPQSQDGPLEAAHTHAVSCAVLSHALEVALTHAHTPTVPVLPLTCVWGNKYIILHSYKTYSMYNNIAIQHKKQNKKQKNKKKQKECMSK